MQNIGFRKTAPEDKLIPNPKARLREQVREVIGLNGWRYVDLDSPESRPSVDHEMYSPLNRATGIGAGRFPFVQIRGIRVKVSAP